MQLNFTTQQGLVLAQGAQCCLLHSLNSARNAIIPKFNIQH